MWMLPRQFQDKDNTRRTIFVSQASALIAGQLKKLTLHLDIKLLVDVGVCP
jgi:hypothetical protein